MKYIKSVIFTALIFSISACVKESLIEENPGLSIEYLDGNQYFMRGNLDGEPFEINHVSETEINKPIQIVSTDILRYGSAFSKLNANDDFDIHLSIIYAMPKIQPFPSFSENIKAGIYTLKNGPSSHYAWHLRYSTVIFKGDEFLRNYDEDFDKIEIKEVQNFDPSDEFGIDQNKFYYKVTGSLQMKLLSDGEPVDFIIDEFSMIFHEQKP